MIPYSFLDLAVVSEGNSITQTLQNSVTTAKLAEAAGYTRYWFAEHHNMKSVASSATSVLIGHIAAHTKNIRVGSGGIMLPNHSPLVIAEHFGTLALLFSGRIDLGLGRAPGTDQVTANALNPQFFENARHFPENVQALQTYFSSANEHAPVRAIPGEGVDVPIWILGSSTDSAHLAAAMGLPYAFASHFAPAQMGQAFSIYHSNFRSNTAQPAYTMACVNIIIAETDAEAERLATSFYQMFLGLIRNKRGYLQPPVDDMKDLWNAMEEAQVKQMTAGSFIGSKETVQQQLESFIHHYRISEVMITSPIYALDKKLYSMQALAELMQEMKMAAVV